MRSEYVIKNSFWTTVNNIANIFIGFVTRTVFIYFLNAEYLGINGLFTNILSILSLSELGFSTAVTYNLYKPLREGDDRKVAALMNFYKWIYRGVAVFILAAGLILTPFLQYVIKDTAFELSYIRIVYVIFLLKTVISYFYSYNYTLATADQKGYLTAKITLAANFIIPIAKIAVLASTRSFIAYIVTEIILNFITNMIKTHYIRIKYPVLKDTEVSLSKEEKVKMMKDVKNIFLGKLSTTILNSTDSIIISSFVNVISVGFMSNYNTLIGYVQTFINGSLYSTQSSIGNAIAAESKEYVLKVLNRLTMITLFVASFACTALFCLSSDFISIVWARNEDMVLPVLTVLVIMINSFFQMIKNPLWMTLTGCGLFAKDKYISIAGAIANLVVSIILVQYMGIDGVIWGTIISQTVQLLLKAKLLFGEYFEMSCKAYLGRMLVCFAVFGVELAAAYMCCSLIPPMNALLAFGIKMVICVIVPNAITVVLFYKTDAFKYLVELVVRTIKKRKGTKSE